MTSKIARQLSAVLSKRVGLAVCLWGEPGIGKTHAAHAILEAIACHHVTLHATADAQQIVNAIPRAKSLPHWVVAQLERGEGLRPETLAALLGANAPFVLHLEDVHEADPQRVALIDGLARAVGQTRGVALLVTSRHERPLPFLNHRLEPLSIAETTRLIEEELKIRPPEDGLAWVFERTRGNPLFTLEFVRYLRRQGFFWSDGEVWHWRKPPNDFVPVSIGALVTELVSSVSTTLEAQTVLEARAMFPSQLGGTDSSRLWAEVVGVDPTVLDELKAAFERVGLLRGDDFAHPLFAEVIAGELEETSKRNLARRALGALRETDPERAAELIPWAGLTDEDALDLLKHAAGHARAQGEAVRAARLTGQAAGYAIGQERVDLALEAEKGIVPTGDYRLREQLARLALDAQPENLAARAALVKVYALMGRVEDVTALIAELPEAQQLEASWIEARVRALSNAGHFAETVAVWEAHQTLLTQTERSSAQHVILAYSNIGELQKAEAMIDELLLRNDLPPPLRNIILNQLALLRSDQGRLEEAKSLHDECIALVEQSGNLHNLGTGYFNRALNRVRLGQVTAARDDTKRAIELFEQVANIAAAAYASIFYGHLLFHQGAFEEAERVLLEAYESYWRWHSGPRRITCEIHIALLYLQWRSPHGDVLASKFSRDALGHARVSSDQGMTHLAMATAARVAVLRGEPTKALELAVEALQLLDENAPLDDDDRYACLVGLAQALELNGREDEALTRWSEATQTAERLHLSLESHQAMLEVARLQSDWESVRSLGAWFAERDLGLGVRRADACLEPPLLASPSLSTARLNVLGTVTLERDGGPVPTRARKRLEILAYLLETRINGRNEASVLELLDALYAGEPETEARNTLKQQVYLIRSTLGADSIVSTPSGYALGSVSSDAEDALRTHDPALWRGAYLCNLGDGWRTGVREALVLELQSSIAGLIPSDAPEAARLGAILTEMEPYDSGALSLRVRALEAAGDLRVARRVFAEGRTRLQEIGEIVPSSLEHFVSA